MNLNLIKSEADLVNEFQVRYLKLMNESGYETAKSREDFNLVYRQLRELENQISNKLTKLRKKK